jgi:glutamine amidotransferase
MAKKVVLVDAGVGNLRSVQHALQSLGADVLRTNLPEDVNNASIIVLPGVGSFGGFMKGLEQLNLVDPILSAAKKGVPFLGICVGMQALFEVGLEMGEFPGLGLLKGKVELFPVKPGLKIPHTGWNQFRAVRPDALLKGLPDGSYTYFNHSYICNPAEEQDVLAETEYGVTYASIVHKENIYGVQFHPEKSQHIGLTLLSNFLELA